MSVGKWSIIRLLLVEPWTARDSILGTNSNRTVLHLSARKRGTNRERGTFPALVIPGVAVAVPDFRILRRAESAIRYSIRSRESSVAVLRKSSRSSEVRDGGGAGYRQLPAGYYAARTHRDQVRHGAVVIGDPLIHDTARRRWETSRILAFLLLPTGYRQLERSSDPSANSRANVAAHDGESRRGEAAGPAPLARAKSNGSRPRRGCAHPPVYPRQFLRRSRQEESLRHVLRTMVNQRVFYYYFSMSVLQQILIERLFCLRCGHCQRLGPTWEQLAEISKEEDSDIKIAKVDCTTESVLCSEQDVTGYPT